MPAGTYALDLKRAGASESLLRTLDLNLLAGWTYTLVVTGSEREDVWVQATVDRVG